MATAPQANMNNSPLPPLPALGAGGSSPSPAGGGLASMLAGIMPVKNAVDQINAAGKMIVQSGAIPGAEQVVAQIIALANSLVPMAAQNAMQPGVGGPGPGAPPPPPGPLTGGLPGTGGPVPPGGNQ